MRVIYFDCFAGISGDMTLGALVDAGLNLDDLKKDLSKLNLAGYEISTGAVSATTLKRKAKKYSNGWRPQRQKYIILQSRKFTFMRSARSMP